MSWWSVSSWNVKKSIRKVLTLSESDKILREDVYFMATHQNNGKFQAVFYDENCKYSFEVNNLTPLDVEMLYKTYPLLYNYVESLPF